MSLVNGFARRVIIEDQRATGVEIEARKKIQVVKARREVVIAASADQLAEAADALGHRAGRGPEAQRHRGGRRPAGVGRNLQDHLELYIQQESLHPITLNSIFNPFSKALIGAQWLFFKTGLGATNHFEAAAFVRSAPGVDYPDIQYHFIPAAVRYDGKAAAPGHGFQAHVGPMRSKSRGAVTLRSPDPWAKPEIRFNYMSHPDDWRDFRHCIRLTREIFGQPAFDPYRGREISPGSEVQSDDELDDFIRLHAESAYHPCGTCKMGSLSDPLSVVDPECRVIGVEGLRVADSSIFPRVTNGNLNGAVDHDRREGRRPHSRPHAAGAVQPGAVDQSALARKRPLNKDMLQTTGTARRSSR